MEGASEIKNLTENITLVQAKYVVQNTGQTHFIQTLLIQTST